MTKSTNIPADLIVSIAKRIKAYQDFIQFRAVCSSWWTATSKESSDKSRCYDEIPCLMLSEETGSNVREFYDMTRGVVHKLMLPEAYAKKCFSSNGWILSIRKTWEMNLVHPLSRRQIKLPNMRKLGGQLRTSYSSNIRKFVLSWNPSSPPEGAVGDCVAVVLHKSCGKLAYCKLGDESWTVMNSSIGSHPSKLLDIIFYNTKLYGINSEGEIMTFDFEGRIYEQKVTNDPYKEPTTLVQKLRVVKPPEVVVTNEQLYLVESLGSLLVVLRKRTEIDNGMYKTTRFRVFEVDLKKGNWEEVKSLRNTSLFLGHNSSVSVEANGTCKANCIYFSDDYSDCYQCTRLGGGYDMGVYNMLDRKIEPHYIGESFSRVTPPIWVQCSFSDVLLS